MQPSPPAAYGWKQEKPRFSTWLETQQTEKFWSYLVQTQFSLKKKKARSEPFVNEYPGPDSNRHGITANGF